MEFDAHRLTLHAHTGLLSFQGTAFDGQVEVRAEIDTLDSGRPVLTAVTITDRGRDQRSTDAWESLLIEESRRAVLAVCGF